MSRISNLAAFSIIFVLLPTSAQAYFGPGAGLGAIAAVLGVIGAILLGLFAILYYPIKRAISKRKSKEKQQPEE